MMYILLAVSAVIFIVTAYLVVNEKTVDFDRKFSEFIFLRRTEPITKLMLFFTYLGKGGASFAVVLLLFIVSDSGSVMPRAAAVSACATIFIGRFLKVMIKRTRPEGNRLVEEKDFSFPSAHALGSAALYGAVALNMTSAPVITAVCILIIVLIGFSRIYLGIHYFADVIGGWSCGLVIALAVTLLWA